MHPIRAVRQALQLTQEEFATMFEVRAQAVARWERGQRLSWRSRQRWLELLRRPEVQQRLRAAGLEVSEPE